MITQKSDKEVAKEAMKELLGLAQNIKNTGAGELPFDIISKAKDYYNRWKNEKIILSKVWVLVLSIIGIMAINDIYVIGFILMLFFVVLYINESSTLKIQYVKDMLGDINHIPMNERQIYLKGLVAELWKDEKNNEEYSNEFDDKKLLMIAGIAFILYSIFFFFDPQMAVFGKITLAMIIKFLIAVVAIVATFLNYKNEPLPEK